MPITVKPIAAIVARYTAGTNGGQPAYVTNSQAASQKQADAAVAAIPLWQQGVAAVTKERMTARLQAAAQNGNYASGVKNKGAQRYTPGVQAGLPKFTNGITAVVNVISGITLPPRGPVGSNLQRVNMINEQLHAAKLGGNL